MEYSKNYRQQLIETIFDFGNTTEYDILHNDNMESDSQSSNENNCSSMDSCSDMNVDNTKEHKEQIISEQEQVDRLTFSYYYYNDQNIIMLLKYTKQANFHGPKDKPGPSLIISRYSENLLKITEKAKAGLQERLRTSMSNIFSVKFIKTDHYHPKNLLTSIKSEFIFGVGRTRIVEILNSNGYKYRSPKLRVKNELQHWNLRLNWYERLTIESCFPDLFFSDKSTFYLDSPDGVRWVKSKENYIHAKKGINLGLGLQLAQEEKHQWICMNKIWMPKTI